MEHHVWRGSGHRVSGSLCPRLSDCVIFVPLVGLWRSEEGDKKKDSCQYGSATIHHDNLIITLWGGGNPPIEINWFMTLVRGRMINIYWATTWQYHRPLAYQWDWPPLSVENIYPMTTDRLGDMNGLLFTHSFLFCESSRKLIANTEIISICHNEPTNCI